ncbi:MAG: nicotinate-nucleotide adenylyltransferase [Yoonia sp.]|nr:nicotinate-nucleotide adenylyltransferase [Yoonia sp.]
MQGDPIAKAGQVVGLLGGSFNPAHDGHVHITKTALKRFGLDRVWWLVSPGNPLKSQGPAPMADRMAQAARVMDHPKVEITDIECRLGTKFTAQTIAGLQRRYPGVRFVWLMGADNLAQFHRWQDWQWIMENVPVGVIARPGDGVSARLSKAATIYRGAMLSARASVAVANGAAPRWCFINLPMSDQSSTAIREQGGWG